MSNKNSSKRDSGAKASAATTSGNKSAARANPNVTRKLREVQLARTAAQLRELGTNRDTLRALDVDPEQYAKELAKRHAELSQKLRTPAPMQARTLSARVASLLDRFGDIFNPWQTILAPNATVGLVQGEIDPDNGIGIASEIYQGDIAVGGNISAGSQEQWWVNTWQYVVPLPPTPSTYTYQGGSLAYRFNVWGTLEFYRQDVVSASVHLYTTVFTTNDMVNRPIQFTQPPVSSDFGINATLPVSDVPPFLYGTSQVTGTIALVPGATPAIGILIGLIFSVQNGYVEFFPGETGEIILTYPDAKVPTDIGHIQYRCDQPFWVSAVSQLVQP